MNAFDNWFGPEPVANWMVPVLLMLTVGEGMAETVGPVLARISVPPLMIFAFVPVKLLLCVPARVNLPVVPVPTNWKASAPGVLELMMPEKVVSVPLAGATVK